MGPLAGFTVDIPVWWGVLFLVGVVTVAFGLAELLADVIDRCNRRRR